MMKYIMKIFGLVIILLISACEHETLLTGEPDDPGDISEDKVRLEIFCTGEFIPPAFDQGTRG